MNAPVWLGLNLTAMVTLAMVTAKVFKLIISQERSV